MGTVGNKKEQKIKNFRVFDFSVLVLLLCCLLFNIYFFSIANIRTDPVDYYTILQKITDPSKKPIVENFHFVEQRSPGYSILALPAYFFISFFIEPHVKTEVIVDRRQPPPVPPEFLPPGFLSYQDNNGHRMPGSLEGMGSERSGIPSRPMRVKDVFFKNFLLERGGGVFEWKIISALILTSYMFLFIGIVFSIKALMLRNDRIVGAALPLLAIFTSSVFMLNIVITPAYATLTAFGLSALFCFFYVASFKKRSFVSQFLCGLFLGFLVLTRFETVLVAGIVCSFLALKKEWVFLKNMILGCLPSLAILGVYNYSQFGTILHFGILKCDINLLEFDLFYAFANLFHPQSGIAVWSCLTFIGLVGLFFGEEQYERFLGVASLVLIGLFLIRLPIMYKNIGKGFLDIGGLAIACPNNMNEMLALVRSDVNRYITVLLPFAVLGLQNFLVKSVRRFI